MLGIDTNVLVRFLVRDDEAQFEKARKLIRREIAAECRIFVNQLVLMETEWVLRSRYAVPKNQIIEAVLGLLMQPISSLRMNLPSRKRCSSGKTPLPILPIA